MATQTQARKSTASRKPRRAPTTGREQAGLDEPTGPAVTPTPKRAPAKQAAAKAAPARVMRKVRPERRSSGVPTSSSSRASALETPDWVTRSTSLTSVSFTPSATC